ncbi:MAG: hypothetical protein ACLS85_00580 [Coprobacillus cateniformis]
MNLFKGRGIHVCTQEFMKGIRQLCDKHEIVMILDEVQWGWDEYIRSRHISNMESCLILFV